MVGLKVFVASSGKAMPLAEALCAEMEALNRTKEYQGLWEIVRWWDKKNEIQTLGQSILPGLIRECAKADLAVALLTGDDITIKRDEEVVLEPRDNCIFEAGLFMGGLGLDETRSVLVTSSEESALPSDIKGVKYLKFPVPTAEQFSCDAWHKKTMETVAKDLALHAKKFQTPPKRPILPVLTPEALMERERPKGPGGGDLETGDGRAVVINTTQPAETKIALAWQVVKNMTSGVDYVYFFRANPGRAPIVVSLLQSLVIARLTKKELNSEARKRFIAAHQPGVLDSLRKAGERLFIHFLPDDRAPLLFCVHNAGDDGKAKCYLRNVEHDSFLLWAEGYTAFAIASDLRRLQKGEHDRAVFYSTEYFDLYGEEGRNFRAKLEQELRRAFSVLPVEKIQELCFF